MIPRRIFGATNELGPPAGWDETRDGRCVRLAVRVQKGEGGGLVAQSAWEPTPDELALLNAGGSVILTVWGGQPPVALHVEHVIGDGPA